MKNRARIWSVLAVFGVITLACLLAPPIRPPKARASRISGVNTLRSVTLTLTNTHALNSTRPGTGK